MQQGKSESGESGRRGAEERVAAPANKRKEKSGRRARRSRRQLAGFRHKSQLCFLGAKAHTHKSWRLSGGENEPRSGSAGETGSGFSNLAARKSASSRRERSLKSAHHANHYNSFADTPLFCRRRRVKGIRGWIIIGRGSRATFMQLGHPSSSSSSSLSGSYRHRTFARLRLYRGEQASVSRRDRGGTEFDTPAAGGQFPVRKQ